MGTIISEFIREPLQSRPAGILSHGPEEENRGVEVKSRATKVRLAWRTWGHGLGVPEKE